MKLILEHSTMLPFVSGPLAGLKWGFQLAGEVIPLMKWEDRYKHLGVLVGPNPDRGLPGETRSWVPIHEGDPCYCKKSYLVCCSGGTISSHARKLSDSCTSHLSDLIWSALVTFGHLTPPKTLILLKECKNLPAKWSAADGHIWRAAHHNQPASIWKKKVRAETLSSI